MAKFSPQIPFFNRILNRLISVYGVLIISVVSVISLSQSYLGMEQLMGGLGTTVADLYRDFLGVTSVLLVAWLVTFSLKKYFAFKLKVPAFLNAVLITLGLGVLLSPLELGGSLGRTLYDFASTMLGGFATYVLFLVGTIFFVDHAYQWGLFSKLFQSVGIKKLAPKTNGKRGGKPPDSAGASITAEVQAKSGSTATPAINPGLHPDTGMVKRGSFKDISLPDLSCLGLVSDERDLDQEPDLSEKLTEGFSSFGVELDVRSREVGHMVTTYYVDFQAGLQLSKIKSLLPDVAVKMRLAENALRLNTAGSTVDSDCGIEVPRELRAQLSLGSMMPIAKSDAAQMAVPICLGVSSLRETIVKDLTSLPHLMVAGSTGSGKSVALNNLIMSIVSLRTPAEAQLVLIDPKAVEFSIYSDLPNLLTGVVTDTQNTTDCLLSLCDVMDSRYEILRDNNVRNIREYQAMSQRGKLQMPYIVVVIDELGDLILEGGKELESAVGRLAQKARAAGIHLVLATQRPTADIVKGLIKTNVPARLAFRVSSRIDSEVILGEKGAESLLGMGDCLFSEVESSGLLRMQAPFVSMTKIQTLCDQLK